MNFLPANFPIMAIVALVIVAAIFIPVSISFLGKRKKSNNNEPETPSIESLPNTPQQGIPLNTLNTPPVSVVKPDNRKYIFLIIGTLGVAILIPVSALLIVKNSNSTPTKQTNTNQQPTTCNVITITDTLDTPLPVEKLKDLRPGDEIKILITSGSTTVEKAHFRINGSQWQEITNKKGLDFIGNYILTIGTKKFTIEAEVFDKTKGWL